MPLLLSERFGAARSAGSQRWRSYLSTVLVRFVIGLMLGFLAGAFLLMGSLVMGRGASGRKSTALLQNFRPAWILQFGATGAAVGATLCVITIRRWQCPWYLSGEDPPY